MSGRESAETSGVLVLVERVGCERLRQVLLGKRVPHVYDHAVERAGFKGLLLDFLKPFVLLPHVPDHGDDVEALLLLQPLDAHGSVEAA